MAIYHFQVSTAKRSANSNSASRYHYIKRDTLKYAKDREEVLYATDGNIPAWAEGEPGTYWMAADAYERKNGRLFKQIEAALPKELSGEEQIRLTLELCDIVTKTKDGPLPYSVAIHKGHGRGNPHFHLIVSERVNDGIERSPEAWFSRAGKRKPGGGIPGAKKTSALKPRQWISDIRKQWEIIANRALELAGVEARIDCRSLAAQGITWRTPGKHMGPARAAIERKRRAAWEAANTVENTPEEEWAAWGESTARERAEAQYVDGLKPYPYPDVEEEADRPSDK